jgi:hypothetical protein
LWIVLDLRQAVGWQCMRANTLLSRDTSYLCTDI